MGSNKLAVLLFFSLGLNLFLGGAFFSRWWFVDEAASAAVPLNNETFMRGVGWQGKGMPPEAKAWAQFGEQSRERMGDVRKAKQAVRQALTAEPFDRAVLEAALTDLRNKMLLAQEAIHGAMLNVAENAPLEKRRTMFMGRGHHHRGGMRRGEAGE